MSRTTVPPAPGRAAPTTTTPTTSAPTSAPATKPRGGRYEEYEPAYRFGHSLRSDQRYAGRSWAEVESEAQRDWSTRYPDSPWQRFKDAVRHAWERVTD